MDKQVLQQILSSINQVDGYGSLEIIIQDYLVTQITVKSIKKIKYHPNQANKAKTDQKLDKAISIY